MSATETASPNKIVLKYNSFVKKGISEDSIVNVVLPYIKSPCEEVQRLGEIVTKYGVNEGGVIFSDKKCLVHGNRGHQLVAERVPNDTYALIPNKLCIGNIDFNDKQNFMYFPTLKEFIKKHDLNKVHKDVNWNRIFGTNNKVDKQYNYPRM